MNEEINYAEQCKHCGAREKSWHHNPPIGGSALDHKFEPCADITEYVMALGAQGTPFLSVTLNCREYYELRYWAKKGLESRENA